MRLFSFICVCVLFTGISGFSQTDSVYYGNQNPVRKKEKPKSEVFQNWREKITVGGNVQALFGNPTFIYLSPTIGYLPYKRLNIGAGFIYNYYSVDYGSYGKYSESIYGSHTYVRYFVIPNLYVQGQYDRLYQPDYYARGRRVWVDYVLGGLGYSQPIGDHLAFHTSLMYNFTPHRLSIYPSRYVIQFGMVARL